VFVLRAAFEVPYEEIGETLGLTANHCRQLMLRARQRLQRPQAGAANSAPSRDEHLRLLTRFLDAARTGNLGELTDLLAEDVVAYSDGGGRVRAALRPIVGRDKVLRFIGGLTRRFGIGAATIVDVNGAPAVRVDVGRQTQILAVQVENGRIAAIYGVLNPDKLRAFVAPER
jgi:RNA polymerase sigma-70 factor (ECF subfamily)